MKDSSNSYIPSSAQTLKSILIVLVSVIMFYLIDSYQIKVIYMIGLGLYFSLSTDRISFVVFCNFVFDRILSLFEEATRAQAYIGTPIIMLGSGVSIGLRDILLVALLIRVVIKLDVKISAGFIWILILVFYGLIIGSASGNFSIKYLIFLFRTFGILLLYFYITGGVQLNGIFKLLHIISFFSFVILFDQLFTYFTGLRLANFLFDVGRVFRITETVIRIMPYGIVTLLLSMLYGFMLMSVKRKRGERIASVTYGAVLIVGSMISVLLSAQRGLAAVFLIVFLVSMRSVITKYRNLMQFFVIMLILYTLLSSYGLGFDFVVANLGTRVTSTINPLLQGQVEEVDTSQRQYEIPQLVSTINESPLVGLGLSQITEIKMNNNFGFPNTIIKFGIIGFFIVLMLIFSWLQKIVYFKKYMEAGSPEYVAITMVQSALLGLFIGYAVTLDYFTSSLDYDYYRLSILLSITTMSIRAFYSRKLNGLKDVHNWSRI